MKSASNKFKGTGKHFSKKEYYLSNIFNDKDRIELSEICANCGCPNGHHNDNTCIPNKGVIVPKFFKALSPNELKKRAFRKFLYDNDALEEWYRNTRNAREGRVKKMLNSICQGSISRAFNWETSPEGHYFWMELDYSWRKECETLI
jgi:hypothetical protein